jgi:hypothetical protein
LVYSFFFFFGYGSLLVVEKNSEKLWEYWWVGGVNTPMAFLDFLGVGFFCAEGAEKNPKEP